MKKSFVLRAILTLTILAAFNTLTQGKNSFIENIGQITDQFNNSRNDVIAKYAVGNSLNIFLSQSGIHYQWTKENELYRMDVRLIGANPNPRITKADQTNYKEQYRLAGLRGTAFGYAKIVYHEIYPNIDWVFYFNEEGKLEHDFVVKEGGNVYNIKLEYRGSDRLKIGLDGSLIAKSSYGTITEMPPYSYELESGKKINSSYVLNGNIMSFTTGNYTGNLIIDPVIDWSTYLGGSEYDDIRDIKVAKDGYVYAVGSTNSTNNIATTGAHLTTFQGGINSSGADAFISKFSAQGNCSWTTYYGGPNVDLGLAISIDTSGDLFIAGRTNSTTGIATPGSHQSVKAGNASGYDAFLLKMDTSGTPIWSTYYGGNFNEGTVGFDMHLDRYNNIYLAGNTNSSTGIVTAGAFQSSKSGSDDGFIAKFNHQGNLLWSTYYGAALTDNINSITTDTAGNLIVVGHTLSTTGLSTANAHLEIGNGGIDAFVAKFDPSGQRLWGSYFGGTGYESMYSVTTDSSNAVYCAGSTNSTSGIASANSFQTAIGGTEDDAFIAKFNSNGSLDWSTYYGGAGSEGCFAIVFRDNKLFYTGNSSSSTNISTPDAIKPVFNNSLSEGVLATFSATGQRLWATYLGGDGGEIVKSIATNGDGDVYLGGITLSPAGLSTPGAHQTIFGGNNDGWLIKIKMCDLPQTPQQIIGENDVCENSQQQFYVDPVNGANSYSWLLPNGWTGISNSNTINTSIGTTSGEIRVVALNSCGTSDTTSMAVSVRPSPQPTIDRNGSILSVLQAFVSYQWMLNGNPINGATGMTYIALENGTYSLRVQGDNGCIGLSEEIVVNDMVSVGNLLKKNGIHIYPNPFSTTVFIESQRLLNLQIVDVTGKVLLTKTGIGKNTHLNLADLPPGNHYFKMFDHKTHEYLGASFLVKTKQ